MMEREDLFYMQRAIELAEKGLGFTNPNPMVGAVVVKNGRVIGEGWHERYGEWHAERNALNHCVENPAGATMYVTLEPCCHYGKTPPCTEAIIESGITRVVVGMQDPNPLVEGKGLERLRTTGIDVVTGIEEERVREQNRVFLNYIAGKKPWIVMKTAMTLDGKIASRSGDSKWVTGPEARAEVQEIRARYMAILVGIGTVEADDPLLNCRITEREVRQPIRIVADSNARVSLDSRLVRTAGEFRTIVAHTRFANEERLRELWVRGVETLPCDDKEGLIDVHDLSRRLRELNIDSVLLEGGGNLNFSFLREGLIDEGYAFIAPKLIGGRNAKTPVEGVGFESMRDSVKLEIKEMRRIGEDLLMFFRV